MEVIRQDPTTPAFVQNPYPFYAQARALGEVVFWEEYNRPALVSHNAINRLLRSPNAGRAPVAPPPRPAHMHDFYAIDDNSMLELEAPRHTRLRKLVLRAFTSRRIGEMHGEIEQLCHRLLDAAPAGSHDILDSYARRLPVIVIARLLGVPEAMSDQLLAWSSDMVAVYQARRNRAIEERANNAAKDFAAWLRGYIEARRTDPADDLISHLIAAEEDGTTLSPDEMVATCVLLLNAGHEATVHTMGNGIKALLEHGQAAAHCRANTVEATTEEIMRYDPPLHMFMRWIYAPIEIGNVTLEPGQEIALLLGAAGRDPGLHSNPDRFDPARPKPDHLAFGAGRHFCLGAPLARLEMQIGLRVLFERMPNLKSTAPPKYADLYHFHGLEKLIVTPA